QGGIYGATYRWNPEQTEAYRIDSAVTETIEYKDASGKRQTQEWFYPGRIECAACHNRVAGYVLGFNARQLNRVVCLEGKAENQIQRFYQAGMFAFDCRSDLLANAKTLVSVNDPHATIENRARSYLDANCSHCHQPGRWYGAWDGRISQSLEQAGI